MDRKITIVSGLPRSGTSMMMKMLEAGGMKTLVDNIRKPDEDNPNGYYELEKAKQVKQDSSWLADAEGKVFKMVSMLLEQLPSERKYRIVFMRRNMEEILASQRKMLRRLKPDSAVFDDREMGLLFEKHLTDTNEWLSKQQNMQILYVSYNDVIKNPREQAKAVNRFQDGALDVDEMVKVVDRHLYRQRFTRIE